MAREFFFDPPWKIDFVAGGNFSLTPPLKSWFRGPGIFLWPPWKIDFVAREFFFDPSWKIDFVYNTGHGSGEVYEKFPIRATVQGGLRKIPYTGHGSGGLRKIPYTGHGSGKSTKVPISELQVIIRSVHGTVEVRSFSSTRIQLQNFVVGWKGNGSSKVLTKSQITRESELIVSVSKFGQKLYRTQSLRPMLAFTFQSISLLKALRKLSFCSEHFSVWAHELHCKIRFVTLSQPTTLHKWQVVCQNNISSFAFFLLSQWHQCCSTLLSGCSYMNDEPRETAGCIE